MILYSPDYENNPFLGFKKTMLVEKQADIKKDGCLLLWGGEDIAPSIYGEKPNKYVYVKSPSDRDTFEMSLILHCIKNNIPMIGICRGAQLLCAVAGGKLAQHIEGHGRSHAVTLHDEGDVEIYCNSSHHQMMLPPSSAVVLASAKGTTGLNQHNEAVKHERVNEVVWFPSINALGIQPHPEWSNCSQDFIDYCNRKIKQYILGA